MDIIEKMQAHIQRLDAVVKAAEIKWGIMLRLQTLVDEELGAKFQRQWGALSLAIMEGRHADVCTLADGAVRGIWAMEAAVMGKGHAPEPLCEIGGNVLAKPEPKYASVEIKQLPKEFWENGGDIIPF